ncbi:MAG TPA: chlorite dismutase family protein, partial [Terriglobales bacterium]|nr:chlorite dismutase family protein [Terriglobales bacterium]
MPQRSPEPRRQVVNFAFFKVASEWRRLPAAERAEQRREFSELIQRWRQSEEMVITSYSLAGLRAEADMMLWRVCYSLECLQEFQAELMATALGTYLSLSRSYLATTRHSQYRIGGYDTAQALRCGGAKYASILPFGKSRQWYQLPFEERQRIVTAYIRNFDDFPRVRLHTLYSLGLDDQEFMIVMESDELA